MRVGLIARADNTGLGIQSKEFFDHIPNCKALVIDISGINLSNVVRPFPERFPNQHFYKLESPFKRPDFSLPVDVINNFLTDIDILFAMETPYDYNIFHKARKRGIKSILQLNYELFSYPSDIHPKPDLFAAPSMWNFEKIPGPKTFLPVPVNLTRFTRQDRPKHFIHIAGKLAMADRNGTSILQNALKYIRKRITLNVHAQESIAFRRPFNSEIIVNVNSTNRANYWDNYHGGILIMPRRYGGLCLPVNEALAAGMPVIMPDCSPNNLWLPKEWLVDCRSSGFIKCKQQVECFDVHPQALAEKIDQFCDPDFYQEAVNKAIDLGKSISWQYLLPTYQNIFEQCLAMKSNI